jgi:hypothetical protein
LWSDLGDTRATTVQQHVYEHLNDFIAIQVERRGDGLTDLP